jgi:hypothetical protein
MDTIQRRWTVFAVKAVEDTSGVPDATGTVNVSKEVYNYGQ